MIPLLNIKLRMDVYLNIKDILNTNKSYLNSEISVEGNNCS